MRNLYIYTSTQGVGIDANVLHNTAKGVQVCPSFFVSKKYPATEFDHDIALSCQISSYVLAMAIPDSISRYPR